MTHQPVQWSIHPTVEMSNGEPTGMYALLPDDDTDGILIGELHDVVNVYQTLKRFIEDGEHAEPIDDLDEQLGWSWITVTEAAEKYGIPVSTVRSWPPKIAGAVKQHGRWCMPEVRLRSLAFKWRQKKGGG